jgi:peroxiredoxin
MTGLNVGERAPGFRLPSAQGPTVSLDDYRGRKNTIVWFTKGMGCVFCRQHMSQLARVAPEFAKRETEVLEVTPTPVERARFYAAKYRLPFLYLCDADDTVRRAWRLGIRRRGPLWYARAVKFGMTAPKPENDFGQEGPGLGEMLTMMRDDDSGLYVVDRSGIVRYAHAGAYADTTSGQVTLRPLPPLDEVLQTLDRCAAA